MSMDRLLEKIAKTQNPTVVGLDPKLDYVPGFIRKQAFEEEGETLKGAAKALYRFNKGIIDAVHDVIPAVKVQAAYYEMYGWPGMKAMQKTIAHAKKKGLYVITDGKRNDIGATMEAYAAAHLGETMVGEERIAAFGADALTVNGYLGTDGIAPLLKVCRKMEKGIFVLVKTSNPSSGELQDLPAGPEGDTRPVYEIMGNMCEHWGGELPGKYGYSGVGAVVGATYPEQLEELRAKLPSTFFLVPGYGAQGGGAEGVAKAFDRDGLGAVVNSSRAVMCAYQKDGSDEKDYAMAALKEVIRMKKDLMSKIGKIVLR